jgi:hypothetical protein
MHEYVKTIKNIVINEIVRSKLEFEFSITTRFTMFLKKIRLNVLGSLM